MSSSTFAAAIGVNRRLFLCRRKRGRNRSVNIRRTKGAEDRAHQSESEQPFRQTGFPGAADAHNPKRRLAAVPPPSCSQEAPYRRRLPDNSKATKIAASAQFLPFSSVARSNGRARVASSASSPAPLGSSRAAGSQVGATCPLRLTARRASLRNSLPIEAHHILCVNKVWQFANCGYNGLRGAINYGAPSPLFGSKSTSRRGPCWPTTQIIFRPTSSSRSVSPRASSTSIWRHPTAFENPCFPTLRVWRFGHCRARIQALRLIWTARAI